MKKASEKEKHATQDARGRLVEDLKNPLPGMEIYPDPTDPLVVIGSFQRDYSTLSSENRTFRPLARIPEAFHTKAGGCGLCNLLSVNSVVVEGHTDQVGPDVANVKLSKERSMAVVEAALNTLNSDPPNHTCFLRLMSASGGGKNDPRFTAIGNIYEGSSRRVLSFRVPSFEQREMKEKLKTISRSGPPARF